MEVVASYSKEEGSWSGQKRTVTGESQLRSLRSTPFSASCYRQTETGCDRTQAQRRGRGDRVLLFFSNVARGELFKMIASVGDSFKSCAFADVQK